MSDEITTQPSENANVEVEDTKAEVENDSEAIDEDPPVRKDEKEEARTFYQQRQLAKNNKEDDVEVEKVKNTEQLPEDYTKKIDKLLSMQQQQLDDKERNEVQALYPNLSKHFAKADKWWSHESRRNLPYKSVLMEIASDELIKIGAEMGAEAINEAKKKSLVGSTNGKVSSAKSTKDMNNQEFNNYVNSIISG